MYQIGDLVIYGNKGVFKVANIAIPDIEWLKNGKEYYTLTPLYKEENVYAPTDTTVYMRRVMSKEQALELIEKIPGVEVEEMVFKNSRSLETYYQKAVDSHDCIALVKIIKRLYHKRLAMEKSGKRLAQIDDKYMRRAESILHEELAAALDIALSDVPSYIEKYIDQKLA